jgi:hypothetical protein
VSAQKVRLRSLIARSSVLSQGECDAYCPV